MFRPAVLKVTRGEDDTWDGEVIPQQLDEESDELFSEYPDDATEFVKFLNNQTDEAAGPVNWAASGMILALHTADGWFVPLGWRDSNAPSHAEKLGTPSGLAENEMEVTHPRVTGYREALEEILIFNTKTRSWVRPTVNDEQLRHIVTEVEEEPTDLYKKWANKQSGITDSFTETPAEIKKFGTDTLTINHPRKDETNTITSEVIIDPQTNNLDVLDLLVVDLTDTPISDLTFFDGEQSDGELLDRPVYLFELTEFFSLLAGKTTAAREQQSGKVWNGDEYTTQIEDAEPVKREFQAVPVLKESHNDLRETLQDLADEE